MRLSKKILPQLRNVNNLVVPGENMFTLPEKVLQFGTGVLLRGLPDYFIDKANRRGVFNGRIVVVKSTTQGSTDEFTDQDNLYTLTVRGIEQGKIINETIIHSCISRVLTAVSEWDKVLECASNPDMQIIVSNTTEVGIAYSEDDIKEAPPKSFPGKLLAFLTERYRVFKGSASSGMVIVPTELIPDNGDKLRSVLEKLATYNKLDKAFIKWLLEANHFCSSLVDRIVPGKLAANDKSDTEKKLGYSDDLLIMAEPFRLWAIESGSELVKEKLSFASVDAGVKIEPSIEKFRELKLRLLNGTHSCACALAIIAGFTTVKEAMDDEHFLAYIQILMKEEISPAILSETITEDDTRDFISSVTDRFGNPYLDHQWKNISVQYSSKMKMRNVPILVNHYKYNSSVPICMAIGFAAYIFLLEIAEGLSPALRHIQDFSLEDDNASRFQNDLNIIADKEKVDAILGKEEFWGADLSLLPGFSKAVVEYLKLFREGRAAEVLRSISSNKVIA